jgi:signal transduction histidine kinase/streptogramin lyase
VRWMTHSPDGSLLVTVGTGDFGPRLLLEYADGRFSERLSGPVIPPEIARTRKALGDTVVEVDSNGRQWVVQDKRLGYLEGTHWIPWMPPEGDPPQTIFRITTSPRGGLWVCADGKIRRMVDGRWDPSSPVYSWPTDGAVMDLMEDSAGQLWAGGWDKGLMLARPDGETKWFTTKNGLPSNIVGSVFEDREHNLWVGTTAGGLLRLRDREFTSYGQMDGLPAGSIACVAKDAAGVCWVGMTANGLWRLPENDGPATQMFLPGNQLGGTVRTLLIGRSGALWAGLHGNWLYRHQAGETTLYTRDQELSHEVFYALFEARDGTLWIGGDRGLSRFDGQKFETLTTRDGLSSDMVSAITQDHVGDLWLGTIDGGLNLFRDGKFRSYTRRDGLAHDSIRALLADDDGTVWIGTAGGGLSRLRGDRFTSYSVKEGLPGNEITSVLDDGLGNLWCGSNRGVFRVARTDLEAFATGGKERLEVVTYRSSDGMASIEAAPGNPAAVRGNDGRLWFATSKHVNVVDPRRIRPNPVPPFAVVEEVWLDGKLKFSNGAANDRPSSSPLLTIPAGNQRLEIRYTGLSLKSSERAHFRHRLVGLEDQWEEAGTRRTATYHSLSPGPYRFEVLAANSDGIWSTTATSLNLQMLPAWWQTWWFRGALGLLLGGGVVAAYEARIRSLTRARVLQEQFSRGLIASQENERQRTARELHDSLGQNLLVIKSRVALAQQQVNQPEKLSEQLGEAAAMTSNAIREVREISQNLRPFQLDEMGLTKALGAMIRKLSPATSIRFIQDIAELRGVLSPEFEINFFRIVQECLNNVVKHSGATECRILVVRDEHGIRAEVSDNGRGMTERSREPVGSGGIGLSSVRERVRTLGGTVEFVSRPGDGTRVVVTVPLRA